MFLLVQPEEGPCPVSPSQFITQLEVYLRWKLLFHWPILRGAPEPEWNGGRARMDGTGV